MLRNRYLLTAILFIFFSALSLNSFAGTLYWVGNGGNWNDAGHWSHTSGGNGGAGIPNSTDDVLFDLNSFSNPSEEVTITGNAICHTLQTLPGIYNPVLVGGGSAEIDIYGSLMLEGPLSYQFQGNLHFMSAQQGNIINDGGRKLSSVYFDGTGSWRIQNLLFASDITISSGEIIANGFEIEAIRLTSKGNNIKTIDITNSILFVEQEFIKQNTTDLKILSQNGRIYFQHHSITDLNTASNSIHRAMSVDSSHYASSNLTCNTNDSINGAPAPCNARAWVTAIYPLPPVGGPYSVVWSKPFGSHVSANGDTIDGICPPSVSYQIFDSSDNSLSSSTIISITEPSALNIAYKVKQPTCTGYCDGSIVYCISGETKPYTYSWYNSGPTGASAGCPANLSYTSLCKGNYKMFMKDSKGCYTSTSNIKLSDPSVVTVIMSETPPTCNSNCNGTATATPSGSHGKPWTYLWNNGQTTSTAQPLCQGTYTVTVKDSLGCIGTNTVTITAPSAVTVSIINPINATCFGQCNGKATASASGGAPVPGYTYLWSPGNQTTQTATGLCAGNYKVVAKDGNSCKDSATITITQPAPLVLTGITASPNPLACNGNCNATANVTSVTGGTPSYSYSWNDGNTNFTNSNQSVSSLCAGKYLVIVTDAQNCTTKDSVTITQPNPISIAVTSIKNPKCKGGATGSICTSASSGTAPYTYKWSPGGQTTACINGLIAGGYTLIVTDKNGCTDSAKMTLTDPSAVVITASGTPPTCFSNCNGTATATASIGNGGPYTYLWSNGKTTSNLSNLCSGTYTITAADDSGCTNSTTVTLIAPSQVFVNPTSQTNIKCNGLCDGKVTVLASGGTPGYTYKWNTVPVQNTATATGLCAGSYKVIATDANGCKDSTTITITQPNPLKFISLTANPNPLLCNGDCNATATSSVTGGTSPYTYSWSDGNTSFSGSGPSVSNLCIGTYVVTLTDAQGCTKKDSVTITQPTPLTVTLNSAINPTCNGSCNGSISTTTSGGTPAYTYLWKPTGQTKANISNLCIGTYTLVVTDKDNCVDSSLVVTLTQPPAITALLTITEVTCNKSCDGKVIASVLGGTPGYTYNWNGGVTQTTDSITGLCATGGGNDSLRVTDASGCASSFFFVVTQPLPLSTVISSQNSSCSACNGNAKVTVGGGTPPYTYSWNTIPAQTTDSAFNLCPGNYTIFVTDADSCKTQQAVTIVPTVTITITSSATGLSCFGSCNGTASANATGGTTPYIYSWSDGQTTSTASNLCAGSYTITVHDQTGCTNFDSVKFANPPPIVGSTSQTNISCNGACIGTAADTVTGGTPPYSYLWSNGQTTSTASALCKGPYTVKITDANLCTHTDTVTILEAPPLVANPTIVLPTCNFADGSIKVSPAGGVGKYTYLWSNGSTKDSIGSLFAGTYTVTITDSHGCSNPFVIALSNASGATLVSSIKNVTCWLSCNGSDSVAVTAGIGPFSFKWSTGSTSSSISGLCAGEYICTVTDGNGCLTSDQDTVKKPTPIHPNISKQNVSCNGANDGSITLTPTGGNAGGYAYTWAAPAVSTTSSATNLIPGTYTITITDSKGCDTMFTVKITQPPLLFVTMSSTPVTCNGSCNGTATGSVHGGTLPYIYSWSNGGIDSNIVNLCPGKDSLSVTDGNGCMTSGKVTITQPTALSAVMSQTNDSCNGGSDGTAMITLNGGTPAYSYSWTGGGTSSSISGLSVGKYIITTTDQNSCPFIDSVTITQPAAISVVITPGNATCNGECNGTATATVSGGTSPYTYAWSNAATSSSITSLCPTTYTVTVTDANKCSATKDTSIGQPSKIQPGASVINTKCPISCDGIASSRPTGGKGPYTFSWSNGKTSSSDSNLCAGTYTLIITDANLCTDTATVTVSSPLPIAANPASSASNCGAVCNGSILVTPSGGTAPYTYLWGNGKTTDSISNVCAGLYTYTITDANKCTAIFSTILSNSSGPTNVGITPSPDSCNGKCDGSIILSPVTGGTPPFVYSFNGGPQQTSDTAKNLCANKYTVMVIDSNLCQLTDTISITQPTSITDVPTITKAICSGNCNGTITLNVKGGTPPYKYLWSSGVGSTTSSAGGLCPGIYTITITDADNCSLIEMDTVKSTINIFPNMATTNPVCHDSCTGTAMVSPTGGTLPYTLNWSTSATTANISALCAGNYAITITDANNCQVFDTAKIKSPPAITATFKTTAITCNGDNNGKIVATITGGTPGYIYEWNTNPGLSTDSIINVSAGSDTIHVTDTNGCKFDSSATLVNPPKLNHINSITPATCNTNNDGSASVTVTGGTPPYTFSWSTGVTSSGVTTSTISNLLPGSYTLSLVDSANCGFMDTIVITADTTVLAKIGNDTSVCSGSPAILNGSASMNASKYEWFALPRTLVGTGATISVTPGATTQYMLVAIDGTCRDSGVVTVTVNPLPVINAGSAQSIFTGGNATLGGSPTAPAGSTYLWQPSAGMKDSTVSNPVITPTVTAVYTVTVTSPFGCKATDTISLFVIPQFIPPDGFTPNGDGINDVWELNQLANFPGASVEVFNRWGERVFHSVGYKLPWDGTYMREPVPVGTYYYVINLNDPRFPNAYTGPVTIMR